MKCVNKRGKQDLPEKFNDTALCCLPDHAVSVFKESNKLRYKGLELQAV